MTTRPTEQIPGRGLPAVSIGAAARVDQVVRIRPEHPDGRRPARARKGLADDVSILAADPSAAHPSVLEVSVDPTTPRAGWAGAVDHGLPWRRAGASVARFHAPGSVVRALDVDGLAAQQVGDFVLGYLLAAHAQDALAADPAPPAPDLNIGIGDGSSAPGISGDVRAAVRESVTAAHTTALARDLAGTPSNIKTPEWLAERYREVLEAAGMDVSILAGDELAGFGGVLAVGGGSANPPRVLVARRPAPGRRVLAVGKGITFDTGGISVKPADGMHLMRTDMAGSAAVVAAAADYCGAAGSSHADAAVPDLTVVVPMAENMLSGSAYRPGDVVTHLGGRTTEVANTDAEGRMVLADGIVHGIRVADPEIIVDAATLTGAMKVALGMRTGAVMSTSDDLAAELSHAGAETGERWWRLPLPDDLDEAVESAIADGKQAPAGPGAITAAKFLQPFTDGRPWAHLDIAGPARAEEAGDEVGPVATGFGARTLACWLRTLAAE